MSVLDVVLSKVRTKRVELVADIWKDYKREVMIPLAQSKEIDSDLIDRYFESLQKTEADLRQDVEIVQGRLSNSAGMKTAERNAQKLQIVEQKIQKLNEDFAEKRRAYEAALAPLASERSSLVGSSDPNIYRERLLRSVQDPKLLKSLADVKQARMEITPRLDWLRIELSRNVNDGLATIRWHISKLEDEIGSLASDDGKLKQIADNLLQYTVGDKSSTEKKRRLVQAREKLEPLLATRAKYEAELSDLERQLSDLQAEERQLHIACLEP
ncbi:MAG: hypothetical protein ACK5YR_12365 [Pirellula sp.]|jgi:hypothetical protein